MEMIYKIIDREVIVRKTNTHIFPKIEAAICQRFELPEIPKSGSGRKGRNPYYRHLFFYFANQETDVPPVYVGQYLGGYDRTTVIHGIKVITDQTGFPVYDQAIISDIEAINELLCSN
jgi:chromosomal replication initiation ATPase DnaA